MIFEGRLFRIMRKVAGQLLATPNFKGRILWQHKHLLQQPMCDLFVGMRFVKVFGHFLAAPKCVID